MPDLKREIETYVTFTGIEGDKFKLTISGTSITVRVMVGADGEQLSLNHIDFYVIVGEVKARERAVEAAAYTRLATGLRPALSDSDSDKAA
jgi:hypothetical protein